MTHETIPDIMLVERVQLGNTDALDVLVQRYQARVYRYAYRLTQDADSASDVVAETFVRLFRCSRSYQGKSSFSTWLFSIVMNCFLDMRKKARSRPCTSLDLFPVEESLMEISPSKPFEELVARERQRTILKRLSGLSELQQKMLLLYHGDMLSYQEIAEKLTLPMGTVKSRLSRARLSLRVALAPDRSLFGVSKHSVA